MNLSLTHTLMVAVAVVVASYLIGGRYQMANRESSMGVFVVDRFTGEVRSCDIAGCETLVLK